MAKLGDKTKDIFQKKSHKPLKAKKEAKKVEEADRPKKAGRPKIHTEDTLKTVITIRKSQLLWLDRLALEVRDKSDQIIDRGLLIRAFIDAVLESKIDLSNITSEEDAKEIIVKKLKK